MMDGIAKHWLEQAAEQQRILAERNRAYALWCELVTAYDYWFLRDMCISLEESK